MQRHDPELAAAPFRASVRIRQNHKPAEATVTSLPDGTLGIEFDEAQRGIAPGQSAVLYRDTLVLGGGVMEALADEMMSVIIETAKDYAMPGTMKDVEIIDSKLGDSAGITGGAVLARRETK